MDEPQRVVIDGSRFLAAARLRSEVEVARRPRKLAGD
jgi:hypothetical protein